MRNISPRSGQTQRSIAYSPPAGTAFGVGTHQLQAVLTPADQNSLPGTYPIVVSGGEAANYVFTRLDGILAITPIGLTIVTQPSDTLSAENQVVIFSVVVSGSSPIAYQWFHNGNPIVGAHTANLALTDVQLSEPGTITLRFPTPSGWSTAGRRR